MKNHAVDHSVKVFVIIYFCRVATSKAGNKMTLQNLATVFGPTLLRPAVNEAQPQTMEELFSVGTREAMLQTSMLLYFLNLRANGAAF